MQDLLGNEMLRGLSTVRVPKDDVLEQLKENRNAHRAKFEEAMSGYKERVLEILEDHINRIKDNDPEKVYIALPIPEDHTGDYDRVIAQLDWSLDTELELSDREFDTYIRDEWGWKESFGQTYAMYTDG